MSLQLPEPITFEEAINLTRSLQEQIKAGQLSEPEIEGIITSLVSSKTGARGFFVAYLTTDKFADDLPSVGVILGLQSSPTIVSELLVKNLAMSTAMAVAHRHNHDEEMARSSDKVAQKTAQLIKKLQIEQVREQLSQLHQTLKTGQGEYQTFLEKFKYDKEQKQAIKKVVFALLTWPLI